MKVEIMKKYLIMGGAVIGAVVCLRMCVAFQPLPKVEFEPPDYIAQEEPEPDGDGHWEELVAMMDYDWAEEWEKRKAEEAKK